MILLPLSFWFLVLACFGLIVGSFLNVVIYRCNTGKSIARGRSQCFACGKALQWYELIPLFSYLAQSGRCRGCRSRISWQYPAVELATALLFVGSYWLVGLSLSLPFYLAILSLLVAIVVYDLRHQIIPDGLVYTFIALATLESLLGGSLSPLINHLLAGILFFLAFYALWRVSSGRWMGFGDAKLALGVGLWRGISDGFSSLVLAFWLGAAVGLALLALSRWRWVKKRFNIKSELPFAPFIILGLLLNLFLNLHVLSFFL